MEAAPASDFRFALTESPLKYYSFFEDPLSGQGVATPAEANCSSARPLDLSMKSYRRKRTSYLNVTDQIRSYRGAIPLSVARKLLKRFLLKWPHLADVSLRGGGYPPPLNPFSPSSQENMTPPQVSGLERLNANRRRCGAILLKKNPLTYIFLQDGNAAKENEETAASSSISASSSSITAARCDKESGNQQTTSSSMNPFKKHSPDDNTWASSSDSSSSEHKSILAPPKLRAPVLEIKAPATTAAGFGSGHSSGILRPSALSTGSVFGGSSSSTSSPVTTSSSSQSKHTFKLKPSMLSGVTSSSSVTSSPQVKDDSDDADSTSSKNSNDENLRSGSSNPFKGGDTSTSTSEKAASSKSASNNSKVSISSFVSSSSELTEVSSDSSVTDSQTLSSGSDNKTSSSISTGRGPTSISASVSSTSSVSSQQRPAFAPLSNGTEPSSSCTEDSNAKVNGLSGATAVSPRVGSGFIFGQNVQTRVSGVEEGRNVFGCVSAASASSVNGEVTTGNLFTAAATGLSSQGPPPSEDGAWGGGKSLLESSRELTEKEASQKRKYEEVEIITGEESESNVLQMMCKLYSWSMGSWQEKGRGLLRLNDRKINGDIHSRLVIRTQGTFTVMLNAKIWGEMSVEKTNDKSVRFTASDADGQPKIFLVMGTPKDIDLLSISLEYRVAASKSQKPEEGDEEEEEEYAQAKKIKTDSAQST